MNTGQTGGFPGGLEGLRRRFEQWRQTHSPRSRLPDSLWAAAVKMAGRYGICQTAKALRLDYYSLKKRFEATSAVPLGREKKEESTFLELPAFASADRCECLLKWENAHGAKMRVHLKGGAVPDLVALSRSFWDRGP
jgi:hypothetical protein